MTKEVFQSSELKYVPPRDINKLPSEEIEKIIKQYRESGSIHGIAGRFNLIPIKLKKYLKLHRINKAKGYNPRKIKSKV